MGVAFDPFSAVETSSEMTLELLLHPQRLSRLIAHKSLDESQLGLEELLDSLIAITFKTTHKDSYYQELQNIINLEFLEQLMYLSSNKNQYPQVNAIVAAKLEEIKQLLLNSSAKKAQEMMEQSFIKMINDFEKNPTVFKKSDAPKIPDGSPIGTSH